MPTSLLFESLNMFGRLGDPGGPEDLGTGDAGCPGGPGGPGLTRLMRKNNELWEKYQFSLSNILLLFMYVLYGKGKRC